MQVSLSGRVTAPSLTLSQYLYDRSRERHGAGEDDRQHRPFFSSFPVAANRRWHPLYGYGDETTSLSFFPS